MQSLREMDPFKAPGMAETIDRAQAPTRLTEGDVDICPDRFSARQGLYDW